MSYPKIVCGMISGILFIGFSIFLFTLLFAYQRLKPQTLCARKWGPVTYLHRGNVTFAQENTFDAVVTGSAFRGHNPEIDVMTLKDGGVVLFHDTDMLRLTGVNKEIKDIDTTEALSTPILQEIDGYKYKSTNSIPELLPVVEAMCDSNEDIGINFDTKSEAAVEVEVSILKNSNCKDSRDNIIFSTPYPGVVVSARKALDKAGLNNRIAVYMPSGKYSIFGLKFFLKTRALQGLFASGSSILSLHKLVHDAEQEIIQSWVEDGWCLGIWGITPDEVSKYEADYYVVDVEPAFPDAPNSDSVYDDDSLASYNVTIVVTVLFLVMGVASFYFVFKSLKRTKTEERDITPRDDDINPQLDIEENKLEFEEGESN